MPPQPDEPYSPVYPVPHLDIETDPELSAQVYEFLENITQNKETGLEIEVSTPSD